MRTLYHGRQVETALAGWLLVGIGGLVCLPLGVAHGAWWLVGLAFPPLLAGLVLLGVRLRVELDPRHGLIHVRRSVLGLRVAARTYRQSDCLGVEVVRVAGDARERPTDTYYLRLRLATARYTLGRYRDRQSVLQAQYQLNELLRAGRAATPGQEPAEPVALPLPEGAASAARCYQEGLALMQAGEWVAARAAFERARDLAAQPLLRRMSQQRLRELEQR